MDRYGTNIADYPSSVVLSQGCGTSTAITSVLRSSGLTYSSSASYSEVLESSSIEVQYTEVSQNRYTESVGVPKPTLYTEVPINPYTKIPRNPFTEVPKNPFTEIPKNP